MSLSRFRPAASRMGQALHLSTNLRGKLPCLCLVTDRTIGEPDSLADRIAQAVAGGVDMVQLREKDLPGGQLLELAIALKKAIASNAILLVNERVDVAIAAGADGVQLGESALPIAPVRNLIGPQALIGRSVHSVEGGGMAASLGADFLLAGTMFSTRSHPGIEPVGPSLIRAIAQNVAGTSNIVPVIGIGGITADNLSEVIHAGASGVAVITSILASSDPKTEAGRLKDAMLDAWRNRSPVVSTSPVA